MLKTITDWRFSMKFGKQKDIGDLDSKSVGIEIKSKFDGQFQEKIA